MKQIIVYKLKINSKKTSAILKILIIVAILLVGCSNRKLIEPVVQIKGTYNYFHEVPKADPDPINTYIDYVTYIIGAIVVVPIVVTGTYEYLVSNGWIRRRLV